jgi:hypothetical protein
MFLRMILADIKSEIIKEIDQLPESILPEILAVLRRLKVDYQDTPNKAILDKFLEQTLAEDKALLEKLAQ